MAGNIEAILYNFFQAIVEQNMVLHGPGLQPATKKGEMKAGYLLQETTRVP